jgi:hypothetical protein
MANGHIISDVNDLALPNSHTPRCKFRREIAHGHIIPDVNDFTFPSPYPLKRGPSRPRFFHWDWRVLDTKRAFCRHCIGRLEGDLLLDGSRSR